MDQDSIRHLYDRDYAKTYNGKFLTSYLTKADADFELRLLGELLSPGMRWLDLACGTGFFLGHFPEVERAGLDLSPAMLDEARQVNPGTPFHEGSFLTDRNEWHDRWDLVSCMWYAYGLVDCVRELETLVENMARWTSPTGSCFVPLSDPALITGHDLPFDQPGCPFPGKVTITGILWSYSEDHGSKVHAHQIAPNVEFMESLFLRHFAHVRLVSYPPSPPNFTVARRALIASQKRPAGQSA